VEKVIVLVVVMAFVEKRAAEHQCGAHPHRSARSPATTSVLSRAAEKINGTS
jgi:hypothetical protein